MMTPLEREQLDLLRKALESRLPTAAMESWVVRRTVAVDLLKRINATWWLVHATDPAAYLADLSAINRRLGWSNPFAQVPEWRSGVDSTILMPPKFFGGDPTALDEDFVASMSLNHAILPIGHRGFERELRDQQSADASFTAHSEYFAQPYAYGRFFGARAHVLRAFAYARGLRDIPSQKSWREVNRRFAFYIELFPTRSKRFRPVSSRELLDELSKTSFLMALNAAVHEVVLKVLRPGWVLLAGKDTWNAWPDPALSDVGTNVQSRVRQVGSPCPVYVTSQTSDLSRKKVRLVRTNFLRVVAGPNSNLELLRLGRDVLGAANESDQTSEGRA